MALAHRLVYAPRMSDPRWAYLALPFTRYELPGWGRIARALGIIDRSRRDAWDAAPVKTIRGKSHGYLMELHLSNWSERLTYFLGRYYELPLQELIAATLAPGDRFVDVGGNIGMVTLLGARAVGPDGLVQTFEPNPHCVERLEAVLALNGIGHVEVIPLGLSDRREELALSVVSGVTGVGTFAPLDAAEHDITEQLTLQLERGDAVLLRQERPVALMKIDVEGFETRAIAGLEGLIARDRPPIVTEVIDKQLRRAGTSAGELFEQMHALGYRGRAIGLRRAGLRHHLRLRAVDGPAEMGDENDIVWLSPDTAASRRLLAGYGAAG